MRRVGKGRVDKGSVKTECKGIARNIKTLSQCGKERKTCNLLDTNV